MAPTAARSLENIGDILRRSPSQGYWMGNVTKLLGTVLADIPIAVPKEGTYLFTAAAGELEISGIGQPLTQCRIVDTENINYIEHTEQGIRVTLRRAMLLDSGVQKITSLLVLNTTSALSASAKSLETLSAPVELLEEFADLTAKLKGRRGTESDRARRDALVSLIGSEYERRKDISITSSTRSTPSSSGESRGASRYSSGG